MCAEGLGRSQRLIFLIQSHWEGLVTLCVTLRPPGSWLAVFTFLLDTIPFRGKEVPFQMWWLLLLPAGDLGMCREEAAPAPGVCTVHGDSRQGSHPSESSPSLALAWLAASPWLASPVAMTQVFHL